MRLPPPARALAWRTGRRFVDWGAGKLKLASYVPLYDYREQLDEHTTFATTDERPATSASRPSTTITST